MNLYLNKLRNRMAIFMLPPLLVIGVPGLSAQPLLTLSDAIAEGLQRNFQINLARNESEIAQRNVNRGNAGYLPFVVAQASVDKSVVDARVRVFTGNELEQSGAVSTNSAASINAGWVLFEGMGRVAAYEKLKELWNISNLETRIRMEEVVTGIIRAYCAIILEKELLEACRERVAVSNFRYNIAKKKRDAGLASEMEWLQSQVLNHADSTALARQETACAKSRITLNQLLATDLERGFVTEDSILGNALPGLEALISGAISNNSSYKLAIRQINLSRLEIKALKSGSYPKITLTGSFGYYENKSEASFIRYNRNFGPHVGLNAGIPIYDGSKLRRDLANAKISTHNHELMASEMEQELAALITRTYLDYGSHLKTIALCREGYRLAQKNLSVASQALEGGLISSLSFREAQEELYEATSTLAHAVYELRVTETDLLRLSGNLIW